MLTKTWNPPGRLSSYCQKLSGDNTEIICRRLLTPGCAASENALRLLSSIAIKPLLLISAIIKAPKYTNVWHIVQLAVISAHNMCHH